MRSQCGNSQILIPTASKAPALSGLSWFREMSPSVYSAIVPHRRLSLLPPLPAAVWLGTCLLFCCCSAADEDDDDGDITPFYANPYKVILPAAEAAPKRAMIRRAGPRLRTFLVELSDFRHHFFPLRLLFLVCASPR